MAVSKSSTPQPQEAERVMKDQGVMAQTAAGLPSAVAIQDVLRVSLDPAGAMRTGLGLQACELVSPPGRDIHEFWKHVHSQKVGGPTPMSSLGAVPHVHRGRISR